MREDHYANGFDARIDQLLDERDTLKASYAEGEKRMIAAYDLLAKENQGFKVAHAASLVLLRAGAIERDKLKATLRRAGKELAFIEEYKLVARNLAPLVDEINEVLNHV